MPEGTDTTSSETGGTDTAATDTTDLHGDVEKWKALARKHEERAKENADKARRFDELDEASKSDIQKATDRAAKAEADAAKAVARANRIEAALAAAPDGMPAQRVMALAGRLQGDTPEALAEDAAAFFADLTPAGGGETETTDDGGTSLPKERLTGGASGKDTEAAPDFAAMADQIHASGGL